MSSKGVIQSNMPAYFKDKYPETRVILDGTKIYVEKASLPDIQQLTFSACKNDNTFKVLIGISSSSWSNNFLFRSSLIIDLSNQICCVLHCQIFGLHYVTNNN